MSGTQKEIESLRQAFAARKQAPEALAECPEAELLFDAASGSLDPGRRMQVIDHVARCAECAMAMRLAMELDARPGGDAQPIPAVTRPRWMPSLALAASLLVAVGLGVSFLLPTELPQPQYRQATDPRAATSMVGDRLARGNFLLRWSAAEPGSTYSLRVSSADLVTLLSRHDLTSNQALVPAELLAKLAPGDQILWQVETRLPDGRQVASETFVVTLE